MNILNCLTLFIFKIFIRPRLCYVEHRQYNTYLIPTYNTYSVFFAPHLYCLLVSTTACILYCISDNEPSRPCATINTHVMYTRKSKTEKKYKKELCCSWSLRCQTVFGGKLSNIWSKAVEVRFPTQWDLPCEKKKLIQLRPYHLSKRIHSNPKVILLYSYTTMTIITACVAKMSLYFRRI